MLKRKSVLTSIIALAIVTGTAVSAYAITYNVKEKNIFQEAAEKGISIADVDKEENFKYTKFDSARSQNAKINQSIEDRDISDDPKVNIFNKMLNTIDYINNVSLTMETDMLSDEIVTVEYQTDINAETAYQKVSSNKAVLSETYSKAENMIYVDNTTKAFTQQYLPTFTREDTPYIPLAERIVTAEDGIPCYSYRNNATNCPYASYCLVPQEITFSYLKDFDKWEIEDDDFQYLGRRCIEIIGKPSPYIAEKHNIDSFTMIVDAETGILMQFKGTINDTVSRYMTVTECSFESRAMIKQFNAGNYSTFAEKTRG